MVHKSVCQNGICKQCRSRSDCSLRTSLIRSTMFTIPLCILWDYNCMYFKRLLHKKQNLGQVQLNYHLIKCSKFQDIYHNRNDNLLVPVSEVPIHQIWSNKAIACWNFLLKNVSSFLQCKSYSHFFSKKYQNIVYWIR